MKWPDQDIQQHDAMTAKLRTLVSKHPVGIASTLRGSRGHNQLPRHVSSGELTRDAEILNQSAEALHAMSMRIRALEKQDV